MKPKHPRYKRQSVMGREDNPARPPVILSFINIPDDQIRRYCESIGVSYNLFNYCNKHGLEFPPPDRPGAA